MKQTLTLDVNTFKNHPSLLHDAVCLDWCFEYEHKELIMHLNCEDSIEKPSQIFFQNVLGHEMVSCDFWGPSPHIFGWSMLMPDQQRLYPRYLEEINKNEYSLARLQPDERYIEVEVLFTSGDRLNVLCQNISVEITR